MAQFLTPAWFDKVEELTAAAGDLVPVDVQGTAIVEVGTGGVTKDAALMVDATGCVVALSGLSKSPVGRAMGAASAGGLVEAVRLAVFPGDAAEKLADPTFDLLRHLGFPFKDNNAKEA